MITLKTNNCRYLFSTQKGKNLNRHHLNPSFYKNVTEHKEII